MIDAEWDFLVNPLIREGGYVRYDGRKSDQLLRDCQALLADYGGRLLQLHELARSTADLKARVFAFYGIGPVTMNIFLRELCPLWRKANRELLPEAFALAEELGVDLADYRRKSLTPARIEAGLMRLSNGRCNGSRRTS